ncbi:aminodeoxychorismate/anthranilate synthase component II [Bacillus sp. ISL-35]|uniref:anthranilate synthase component II n=1 Tax=Bacillus sp. ISL-35 TaxID=2819122 RepID=UPI001BEA7B05|nr:aminodeoxychorismate/anthranilate synthase component II [Bacillus sp. ISL-35]MBT2677906.1 aminodeoxychorismate/anthranilate synthase component II [Bacillus sp. ISL-35]MBT2704955.1 aminodeoxychorismate/anthranilate synthase component II [Chryseobacterium sp. ISL-80]
MILLIDNYDSFTYNLYQYLSELGAEVRTVRNDKITVQEISLMEPEAIVLSPGPGRPEQAGICVEAVKHFAPTIPILGICLGHQAIAYSFGSSIIKARKIRHGKESTLNHTGTSLMMDLEEHPEVMRYHSLVIDRLTLDQDFEILALAADDDEIMSIKHKNYPLYGLQFHPESIGTKSGKQILANFLSEIRKGLLTYETLS